ncbi:TPA: hypothetical protein N0F65_001441 [Lagenidium giganteum]|uniref:C2H2-type domain-containing protein n=1 Tax=Lagenidium giganteum TaxID=4803 RepID=A0AAV2Z208_9STRA|nr:TPA: hypothetical protein N0F65_001441 [Lagenidium giganteum]
MKHEARFCWRERVERLNWRLLKALDLSGVVRDGDPTVLEPYVLHATFARLPPVNAGSDNALQRDAWFLVRMFQLSTEYLLSMRSRDAHLVESLHEELDIVTKDCNANVERVKKWKDRARSRSAQVEQLHQVLQNIAKVLHVHGASDEALQTVQKLLTQMQTTPEDHDRWSGKRGGADVQEQARVCGFCGKMFASPTFLDKHVARRHAGQQPMVMGDVVAEAWVAEPRRRVRQQSNNESNDGDRQVQSMLHQMESVIAQHQENLRTLAQQEADKLRHLYQDLHVENQLAEEIKSSRLAMETQVAEAKKALEIVLAEKEHAALEFRELQAQMDFLRSRQRIERVGTNKTATGLCPTVEVADPLEMKRLEQALSFANSALTEAREELARQQTQHVIVLKEKQLLQSELEATQANLKRLEVSVIKSMDTTTVIPPVMIDFQCQVDLKLESAVASVQTDPCTPTTTEVLPAPSVSDTDTQTELPPKLEHISTQTDEEEPEKLIVELQKEIPLGPATPLNVVEPDLPQAKPRDAGESTDASAMTDYEHDKWVKMVLDQADARANSAANALGAIQNKNPSPRNNVRLRGHQFLQSRYPHPEDRIKERIASYVDRLEAFADRFGVSASSSILSSDHLQLVQHALHAHLEVLPTNVLKRMIHCENEVNALIVNEWIPLERVRHDTLEKLKAEQDEKSRRNQDLVKLAMFGMGGVPQAISATVIPSARALSDDASATQQEPPTSTTFPLQPDSLMAKVNPATINLAEAKLQNHDELNDSPTVNSLPEPPQVASVISERTDSISRLVQQKVVDIGAKQPNAMSSETEALKEPSDSIAQEKNTSEDVTELSDDTHINVDPISQVKQRPVIQAKQDDQPVVTMTANDDHMSDKDQHILSVHQSSAVAEQGETRTQHSVRPPEGDQPMAPDDVITEERDDDCQAPSSILPSAMENKQDDVVAAQRQGRPTDSKKDLSALTSESASFIVTKGEGTDLEGQTHQ